MDADSTVPIAPATEDPCAAGLARAIRAAGGTHRALADKLGLSRAAISQWDKIPVNRLAAVSRVTGIPLSELRPDLDFSASPTEAA